MFRLYRYVFYRILWHQRRRIPDRREADFAALMYIAAVPLLVLTSLVILISETRIGGVLSASLSHLPLGMLLFGVICVIHYVLLGTEQRIAGIEAEFHGKNAYGRWGGFLVVAFFVFSIVLLVVALVVRH